MSIVEIKVPDIGGHENVDIIAVEVKAGDTIALDDTLITLETDKATMDVPADAAGVVKEVKVKVGDKVSEGDVIVLVEAAGAGAAAAPAAAPKAEAAPAPAAPAAAPAAAANVQVAVPDIGGHTDVDVIAVEVKVGDTVAVDDTLITLETDKATMDVPSTAAGTVTAVHIKVGDKVSEGSIIIDVAAAGAPAAAAPAAAEAPKAASAPAASNENQTETHAPPLKKSEISPRCPCRSGHCRLRQRTRERSRFRQSPRRPLRPQTGARTGRGFEPGERQRQQRPHHQR